MRRRFMSASGIPDNQIWYTSNDGNIIDVKTVPSLGSPVPEQYGLGSVIISNQYYDKGVITTLGYVTQIGRSAFKGQTSLVSMTLPSQVAVIYDVAFNECTSLSQIDLKNVTTIESSAFSGCTSLSQIDLENITTIDDHVFYGCHSLTSVTIGNSVTSIGNYAFGDCTSLKEVYCKPTTPPTGTNTIFGNNASGRKIYVPRESVGAYKAAPGWRNYASDIEGYDF